MKSLLEAEARSYDDQSINKQVKHMKETFETTANELGGQAEVLVEKLSGFEVSEADKVTQYAISSALALGLKVILVLLVVVQTATS